MEWNYKSSTMVSTGYEDVLDLMKKKYTKEIFKSLNEEEQEKMIQEVFEIYRNKNIFPIQYFNEEGIKKQIEKCINKEVLFNGEVLDFKFNQGSALCKFLFPNLQKVKTEGENSRTMYKKFYDDHLLKRAIKLSLSIKKSVTPSEIRTSMELIGGTLATNFKPMNAKALYENYVPKNGIIYDFAGGFGGRMLGALSSKNEYKYIAVEPCNETYEGLLQLGEHIESVTKRNNSFEIYKIGSEDFDYGKQGFVDFAFSSPPYFNLEVYSDEETQCYNKFNELDLWMEGYARQTIKNIYKLLKDGGKYAVNIADFKFRNKNVNFVDRWIEISEEEGFEFIDTVFMSLKARKGVGHNEDKKEGIFVFIKK